MTQLKASLTHASHNIFERKRYIGDIVVVKKPILERTIKCHHNCQNLTSVGLFIHKYFGNDRFLDKNHQFELFL